MEKETGKNRKATEQQLLKAVDELVGESGFEKLGINVIASRAGVSKMLIYRYFDSLEGLIAAYIRQYDFWINFDLPLPEKEGLADFIRQMFHLQIITLRKNYTLRRLYRWELSTDNTFVRELRRQREQKGLQLVEAVSRVSGRPREEVAFIATLISSSVSYLTLLEENCPFYNGFPIQEDQGWQQLENHLYQLIGQWFLQK